MAETLLYIFCTAIVFLAYSVVGGAVNKLLVAKFSMSTIDSDFLSMVWPVSLPFVLIVVSLAKAWAGGKRLYDIFSKDVEK